LSWWILKIETARAGTGFRVFQFWGNLTNPWFAREQNQWQKNQWRIGTGQ
jgi:hypothetical protein